MARQEIAPLIMSLGRELEPRDLETLDLRLPISPPPIKQLRAIHLRQAQLLAEGRSASEVAALVGSTTARVEQLRNDPTFRDLVATYTEQQATIEIETQRRMQDRLVDVLEISVMEMQARLEDDDRRAGMSLMELRKTAEFAADRTIAPPRATQGGNVLPPQSINVNFGYIAPQQPAPSAEPKVVEHEE